MTLRELREAAKKIRFPNPDGTVLVLCTREVEDAVRALPNFTSAEQYKLRRPAPNEIGCVEIFRFERTDGLEPGAWAIYHPEPGF